MKVMMFVLFLLASFYNFYVSRENTLYVARNNYLIMVFILFSLLSFYLCYKFDQTILATGLVVSALIYVASFAFTPGIGSKGLNIMMGTTLIKKISFHEIDRIEYKEGRNKHIELIIHAFGHEYRQIYESKDKSKIIELLKALKGQGM